MYEQLWILIWQFNQERGAAYLINPPPLQKISNNTIVVVTG